MPKRPPKITNPILESYLGSWDATLTTMGGPGTGFSHTRKVAGDTAILTESQAAIGPMTVRGVQVYRLDEDGKTVHVWRFDTFSPSGVSAFTGTLTEDGFEAKTPEGMGLVARKKDAGFEMALTRGPQTVFSATYAKREKEPTFDAPDAPKAGLAFAMHGTWDAKAEWKMAEGQTISATGPSTFRWALGGRALIHEYERNWGAGVDRGLGIHRWPEDGSSMKVWFFESEHGEPMFAEGPATAESWQGKSVMPEGPMELNLAKKGEDAWEMRFKTNGKDSGFESFVKRK
jgi:hypothetical protein